MKKIILIILFFCPMVLFAQSATDYFHIAANYYVNAEKKAAQSTIGEGIQKFPNNQKLKNLAAKIEELPDPDDQNQKNQQDQDQKDQQNQDQQDQKNQDQKDQDQKKDAQQQQQISREDAQRLLDAIAQEEKDLQEKLQKKERAGHRGKIEKNW